MADLKDWKDAFSFNEEKRKAYDAKVAEEMQDSMRYTYVRVQRASDEAIEDEIRRLKASPYVKLAQHEQEIRAAKIRLRDELLALEHRGQKLAEQGWSLEEWGGDDAED